MSEELLNRSSLWRSAFSERADGRDLDRRELEQALIQFRRRVSPLLGIIARDMPGYTVHDISHIDALWEMADIIAGTDFELNPAEAFVFGGAVLLHDAGMSLAAYPGGLPELQKTFAWQDNSQAARRFLSISVDEEQDSLLCRKDFLDIALTGTLRDLHADAAARLVRQKWTSKVGGDPEFLLERSDLREFFGEAIGQIAASHHWDGGEVLSRLSIPLNAYTSHPNNWTVDKVKLALLLRCSDAAHIDSRRAPRLLFALTKPQGISSKHWLFQSKIAKPLALEGRLRYTSSSTFGVDEVDSWQLAWDTIRMIDKELGFADEVLKQRKLKTFAVSGADGAKFPQALAQFVQVDGWTPILPEIMVSDVAHLAKTLGGQDLYSNEFTPIRELIQNAADAIEARATIDDDFVLDDGKIVIKIEELNADEIIITFEDNGIGMSERVLTGPLIDFGKSFWKSALARTEYPGLQGKFGEPRGRYGIGFFSIFMWADDVVISSRPFSSSRADTKILQFSGGLGRRPIMRDALPGEYLGEAKTRIRLQVARKRVAHAFVRSDRPRRTGRDRYGFLPRERGDLGPQNSWRELIAFICAILPIKVYLDEDGVRSLVNLPDWRTVASDRFVSFFSSGLNKVFSTAYTKEAAERVGFVTENGNVVGRALLARDEDNGGLAVYEKGIFVSFNGRGVNGVIEGRSVGADRESADFDSPIENKDWMAEQEKKIFALDADLGEKLASQAALIKIERFSESQPLFVLNREFLSLTQALEKLHTYKQVELVFLEDGGDTGQFDWQVPDSLSIVTGRRVTSTRLHPLVKFNLKISQRFSIQNTLANYATTAFGQVLSRIIDVLGKSAEMKERFAYVNSYDRRRFLYISIVSR